MQLKLRQALRTQGDQTRIVWTRADFGKPDLITLHKQLNAEDAATTKVSCDRLGDIA